MTKSDDSGHRTVMEKSPAGWEVDADDGWVTLTVDTSAGRLRLYFDLGDAEAMIRQLRSAARRVRRRSR